ncbi:tyrosine-type recombinase/integrase [Salimicrobium flavidum]|uniref:Site-specific recombinase XerD n=1 Tax=Salimicrobium flavidum TaxID=570947 RepID=A0A1N7IWS8_9BACI|nr:tyrosine-type recombinase/integrase [Salimicrobium flavidum]SIS41529.1 Site-specific recombinase XerD [Salimicrobium flavidum]
MNALLWKVAVEKFVLWMISMERSQQTIDGYQKDLKMIGNYLAKRYNTQVFIEDITTEDLESYLYMLKEEKGYQASSRNRHLHTMRSFFNFCIKKEYLTRSPAAAIEKVRVQQKERDFLSDEEADTLIENIDHELIQFVVKVLNMTGLRISECLNLTLHDVDLENKRIHVRHGKGNKDRFVPINNHLAPMLENYKSHTRVRTQSNYFFATKKTGRLSPVYVNRVLGETVEKLGWERKITAHTFRHSFASRLSRRATLGDVQKILGHSNVKTTSIYLHSTYDQLEEAINTL